MIEKSFKSPGSRHSFVCSHKLVLSTDSKQTIKNKHSLADSIKTYVTVIQKLYHLFGRDKTFFEEVAHEGVDVTIG